MKKAALLSAVLCAALCGQKPTKLAAEQVTPAHGFVIGEVPKPGAANTWTLANAPAMGAACYLNGVRLANGSDFTVSGTVLSMPYWGPMITAQSNETWVLLCDYVF